MNLNNTVSMMNSDDYKERFKAEYWQTKIRYEKLHKLIVRHEAGTLDFKLSCPIMILEAQKRHMGEYLHVLQIRAEIEEIDLEGLNMEDGHE